MFNRQVWNKASLLRRSVLFCAVLFCTVALMALISPAIAPPVLGQLQLPSLTTPGGTQPLPTGVERRGTLESAGVRLDGEELFRIASPAVNNRSEPGDQIPVEVRAKQIEANLEQLVLGDNLADGEMLDPDTLEVLVETVNGQPVLFVKDATLAEARVLLTVTNADAQQASISPDRLAARWQEILQRELRQAIALRQPEAIQQQLSTVARVLTGTALLTLILGAVWGFLGQRKQHLERRQAAEEELIHNRPEVPNIAPGLLQELRPYFGLQQRLQVVRFLRWLLFWAIGFIWVLGVAYSFNTFPQTRQFARTVIAVPAVMLTAWFLTGLTNRLTDFGIDRFIQSREQDQSLTEANLQRIATIARVIKGLKMVLVYTVAILWVLQRLDLAPGSVLTLGALLALAVSFAAQSLVKDLVNGFLILLEDQFRIGDNVNIGDVSGMVENMNLRVTQIRNDEGGLITLPNSLIAEVENRSRTWARTDFRVEVAYHTDVDHALAVVRETVDRMAQDPEWSAAILDTQELLGVDQISHTGIVIRVLIKTAPLQQWAIARELRRRVKIAFDRHNIQIGIPQRIWLGNGSSQAAEDAQIN